MTQPATEQEQQMEAAARSVAAKLQTFRESLTPDEQRVLDGALRSVAAGAGDTADDTTGYASTLGYLTLIVNALYVSTLAQEALAPASPSPQSQR